MMLCRLALLTTIAFVIGGGGLISVVLLFTLTGGQVPFDYGIVVDAGSTHSEAFLYKWLGSKDHGTADAYQENSRVVEGGISDVKNADGMLSTIRNVIQSIPSTFRSRTPLYLAATAGMRLLNATRPRESELILLTLRCALQKIGADLRSVSIISGHDEGLFSWITSNYVTKTLHRATVMWNETLGALDLGGASTQFAYAVEPHTGEDATIIQLFGANYTILARSYLCYGLEQAVLRHHSLLLEDLNSNETVIDPCLPKGYNVSYTGEKLLNQLCTATRQSALWLLEDVRHKEKIFVFEGSSDFEKCGEQVSAQLNSSLCRKAGLNNCVVPLDDRNFPNKKYLAFSNFFYVTNFMNSTESSIDEFRTEIRKWCRIEWPQIEDRHYEKSSYTHLTKYCFGGHLLLEWLTSIYGFDRETWKNINFQQKVNGIEIGWALGYMINATNAIREKSKAPPVLSKITFITLTFLCVLLIVVSILFFLKCFRRTNPSRLL